VECTEFYFILFCFILLYLYWGRWKRGTGKRGTDKVWKA